MTALIGGIGVFLLWMTFRMLTMKHEIKEKLRNNAARNELIRLTLNENISTYGKAAKTKAGQTKTREAGHRNTNRD